MWFDIIERCCLRHLDAIFSKESCENLRDDDDYWTMSIFCYLETAFHPLSALLHFDLLNRLCSLWYLYSWWSAKIRRLPDEDTGRCPGSYVITTDLLSESVAYFVRDVWKHASNVKLNDEKNLQSCWESMRRKQWMLPACFDVVENHPDVSCL